MSFEDLIQILLLAKQSPQVYCFLLNITVGVMFSCFINKRGAYELQ